MTDMAPSNATNNTLPANLTEAPPTAAPARNSKKPATTRYPVPIYGPIGVHKRKPVSVVGTGSTGHMTGIDSGGSLGIVMAVALALSLVLMLFLWWRAGEQLDDEEETLLEDFEGRTADADVAETRTEAETQPETSDAQETTGGSSLTEEPPVNEVNEEAGGSSLTEEPPDGQNIGA